MQAIKERLDEHQNEEARGVFNGMQFVENIVDFNTDLAKEIGENTGLLQFLLNRCTGRTLFDSNKLYASEVRTAFCSVPQAPGRSKNKERRRRRLGWIWTATPLASFSLLACDQLFRCCQFCCKTLRRTSEKSPRIKAT